MGWKINTDKIKWGLLYAKPLMYILGGITCVVGAAVSSNKLGVIQGIQTTVVEYEKDPENFEEDFVNVLHPKKD